jgi:hypothetical protein
MWRRKRKTERSGKIQRGLGESRVLWRRSRRFYKARRGWWRRHCGNDGPDVVEMEVLISSANHFVPHASGCGEDEDEDVATNKYPRWSSGGRHRRGARRRAGGHARKKKKKNVSSFPRPRSGIGLLGWAVGPARWASADGFVA